ncbi:MAG: hypothetical protein JNL48_11810 [Acidobacteria bacterium]|nr:hypothetical protein [Acidobacteriota bacterium]
MTRLGPWGIALLGALLLADTAVAQPALWRPWHPVVSVGGGWTGQEALGTVRAETRAIGLGTLTPSAFPLFTADSTFDAGPRAELGVAVPVTRTLLVEVLGTMTRPTLSTAISRDAEGAPATTVSETVDDYTVGARLLYDVPRLSIGARARPYVLAGGAYLRQLHEDQVLVETGQAWSAGAGLRVWIAGARQGRSLGVTTELAWQWRTGGIAFTDGARGVPSLSLRLFAGL